MNQYKRKKAVDIVILLCSIILAICIYFLPWKEGWSLAGLGLLLIFAVVSMIDLCHLSKKRTEKEKIHPIKSTKIERLILLDEQEKPIKSWEIANQIGFVIGRTGKEIQVDIDLEGCEYSSLIDFEHATLNFCMEHWYVEDLNSHNGVKIKKVEDGQCYKVMGRPCRVGVGDILYIANTRLLLS